MASTVTALQISEKDIRLISGQWPNISVCAHTERTNPDDLELDLKQMVSGLKLKEHSCVLVVPRRDAVFKILKFPSADAGEIQRMLALQIPVVVPFEASQVVYQHYDLKTKDSGYSDILLAVILNATIQKYIDAVYSAGLTVKDVYLSFDAQAQYSRQFLLSQFRDVFCCAVMICGRFSSEMIILQDHKAVFSCHFPYGAQDCAEHAKEFALAIASAVQDYEKNDSSQEVKHIYFGSGLNQPEQLKAQLAAIKKREISIIDFFEKVPDTVKTAVENNDMHEGWIPLLGCLSQEDRKDFKSFLPAQILSKKAKKQAQKMMAHFAVAFMLMIALIIGLFQSILYKHQQYLDKINQKIESVAPQVEKMKAETGFLNLMRQQSAPGNSVVALIKEVYAVFPDQATIQFFNMKSPGVFELQGITLEDQDVNQIQSALLRSKKFQNVDLKYTTKRKRFKEEYTEFKITFESAQ